ncbi:MAG: hypothetical protein AAFR84_07820 [Pseudomonadota bacterium]
MAVFFPSLAFGLIAYLVTLPIAVLAAVVALWALGIEGAGWEAGIAEPLNTVVGERGAGALPSLRTMLLAPAGLLFALQIFIAQRVVLRLAGMAIPGVKPGIGGFISWLFFPVFDSRWTWRFRALTVVGVLILLWLPFIAGSTERLQSPTLSAGWFAMRLSDVVPETPLVVSEVWAIGLSLAAIFMLAGRGMALIATGLTFKPMFSFLPIINIGAVAVLLAFVARAGAEDVVTLLASLSALTDLVTLGVLWMLYLSFAGTLMASSAALSARANIDAGVVRAVRAAGHRGRLPNLRELRQLVLKSRHEMEHETYVPDGAALAAHFSRSMPVDPGARAPRAAAEMPLAAPTATGPAAARGATGPVVAQGSVKAPWRPLDPERLEARNVSAARMNFSFIAPVVGLSIFLVILPIGLPVAVGIGALTAKVAVLELPAWSAVLIKFWVIVTVLLSFFFSFLLVGVICRFVGLWRATMPRLFDRFGVFLLYPGLSKQRAPVGILAVVGVILAFFTARNGELPTIATLDDRLSALVPGAVLPSDELALVVLCITVLLAGSGRGMALCAAGLRIEPDPSIVAGVMVAFWGIIFALVTRFFFDDLVLSLARFEVLLPAPGVTVGAVALLWLGAAIAGLAALSAVHVRDTMDQALERSLGRSLAWPMEYKLERPGFLDRVAGHA